MTRENMFGKMRGRFDEKAALAAREYIIERFVWGFASLPDEDKARAVEEFNAFHDDPRKRKRWHIIYRGDTDELLSKGE
jgi:hypothetical protein